MYPNNDNDIKETQTKQKKHLFSIAKSHVKISSRFYICRGLNWERDEK